MNINYQNIGKMSPDLLKTLDTVNASKRKIFNAATIQEGSTAECIATSLFNEIIKFQSTLPEQDDVILVLVQFSREISIVVRGIGYIGYNLVYFYGEDTDGKPMELIQHVQQLNLLLSVYPKPEPETPKRQIGFVGQVD